MYGPAKRISVWVSSWSGSQNLDDPLVLAHERRTNNPEGRTLRGFPFQPRDREVLLVDPGFPDEQILVAAFGHEREDVAVAAGQPVAPNELRVVVGGGNGAVGLVLARGRLRLGAPSPAEYTPLDPPDAMRAAMVLKVFVEGATNWHRDQELGVALMARLEDGVAAGREIGLERRIALARSPAGAVRRWPTHRRRSGVSSARERGRGDRRG